jgi:hypothetical protein
MEGRPPHRFTLLPRSALGWWSVALAVLTVAWVIAGQPLQHALNPRACPGGVLCTGGREYVALALLLGAPASVLGLVALVRYGERSLLVWLTVVPTVLFTAFWLLFAAGELLSPY